MEVPVFGEIYPWWQFPTLQPTITWNPQGCFVPPNSVTFSPSTGRRHGVDVPPVCSCGNREMFWSEDFDDYGCLECGSWYLGACGDQACVTCSDKPDRPDEGRA